MLKSDIELAFLSARIDPIIPIIDLHGTSSPEEALEKLEHEFYVLSRQRTRYCIVIHGVGTGALAKHVQVTLDHHPLVRAWEESNGGSCLVLF